MFKLLIEELMERLMFLKDNITKIPKWDEDLLRVYTIHIKQLQTTIKERENEFIKSK